LKIKTDKITIQPNITGKENNILFLDWHLFTLIF
jgi:prepilin-type processing-associated H-X9-DG protein